MMASEWARGVAAQAWCTEETKHLELDPVLAEAFADKIDAYIEALIWCSGSADFADGGRARTGWLKICEPLLR